MNALNSKIPSLSGLFVVESKRTGSASIAANTYGEVTVNVAKSGYTALGVVGWSGSGVSFFCACEVYVANNVFHYSCLNQTSASHNLNYITAQILYMKNL